MRLILERVIALVKLGCRVGRHEAVIQHTQSPHSSSMSSHLPEGPEKQPPDNSRDKSGDSYSDGEWV